jgi:hypothetical protein
MRNPLGMVAAAGLLACGDAGPASIAQGEQGPLAVAADSGGVYWLAAGAPSASGPALRRSGLNGGAAVTLASDFNDPRALVASGGAVYWASGDGAIRKVASSGGAAVTVATDVPGAVPFAIAVAGDTVYWLSNLMVAGQDPKGSLASAPAGGGARTVISNFPGWADAALMYPSLLTTDGNAVAWGQADGSIQLYDAQGIQNVAKFQGKLGGVALLGTICYYLQYFGNAVALVRKPLASFDAPQLVIVVPASDSFTTDGKSLYLAGPTSVAASKVALPEGSLTTILSHDAGARSIAPGPGSVFVATVDGRILKLGR